MGTWQLWARVVAFPFLLLLSQLVKMLIIHVKIKIPFSRIQLNANQY